MAITLNGSAGVTTNSGAVYDGISRGTAVASTSGTSIDFTSIPSWVKKISVMLSGVSTSGTSITQIQLGSGSVTTTGYIGTVDSWSSTLNGTTASITSGLALYRSAFGSATNVLNGIATFTNLSSNNWVGTFTGSITTSAIVITLASTQISLSGTLDRIRITTVNGTDTFDAGSINILYE
jgi:hypothetical protein